MKKLIMYCGILETQTMSFDTKKPTIIYIPNGIYIPTEVYNN